MKIDSEASPSPRIARFAGCSPKQLAGKLPSFLKSCLVYPVLAIGVLWSGCASQQSRLVLDPVGPAPIGAAGTNMTSGSLMVFSAGVAVPDLTAEISGAPSDDWEYSSYKILSPEGKLLKSVANNTGTVRLHPKQIELPAGRYCVVAKARGYGQVTVPVLITRNQLTVLHLDGEGLEPRGINETNTVHLPNGQSVGWRALAENTATP